MNPTPSADEMAPLDQARPDTEVELQTAFRRSRSTSLARWHLLRGQRSQSAPPASKSRRGRYRSRAVLLWVLLWYIAAQIFPNLISYRWDRIGPANERRKWPVLQRLAAEDPDRPLLVMLGSSRAAHAFRAGDLDGMADSDGRRLHVYNFGIPTSGPSYELMCLRDMVAKGIRPRFLLIEFVPSLMCQWQRGALTEEIMLGFESYSARRMLEWLPYLNHPRKWVYLWLQSRMAPWYFYRRTIQMEVKCLSSGEPLPCYDPIDEWGWRIAISGQFTPVERQFRLFWAHGGYASGLEHFRLGKKPTKALRDLLDLCRREKIPAALVIMPESSTFRGWYSDQAKKALSGLLDEVKQTYGVAVIDAKCWIADDDFADGHHTLWHGAEVFTSRIRAELPRLLAQSQAAKSD